MCRAEPYWQAACLLMSSHAWPQILISSRTSPGLERKTKTPWGVVFSGWRWQDRLRTVSVSTPSVMSRSLSGPLLGEIITGGVLVPSWDNQPAPHHLHLHLLLLLDILIIKLTSSLHTKVPFWQFIKQFYAAVLYKKKWKGKISNYQDWRLNYK